jgi:hypothetical protein
MPDSIVIGFGAGLALLLVLVIQLKIDIKNLQKPTRQRNNSCRRTKPSRNTWGRSRR